MMKNQLAMLQYPIYTEGNLHPNSCANISELFRLFHKHPEFKIKIEVIPY